MASKSYEYTVTVQEDGKYLAEFTETGWATEGSTLAEAKENAVDCLAVCDPQGVAVYKE